jgi:secondary thiamine-phosphate synthase enzyme
MRFSLKTKGFNDVVDITERVLEIVEDSKIEDGICLIFCPGSTCAITTIEYEGGLIEDLKRVLEKIIPMAENYEHCKKWGDCNGYAHIRSALLKPSLALPIEKGKLVLGTWQNIVFLDFDNREREREIIVKIVAS